jgi:DNA-binding transcriptional LysR family regulator
MTSPDFNLLMTLDALLQEGSVAGAARRLKLSQSAMSRALARLRDVTGDPLLVRAGRNLVPTPRALQLKEEVSQLVSGTQAVLRPVGLPDLAQIQRTFTLRCREGFTENFGPALITRVMQEAPGIRLHFVNKADKDSTPLREGTVDLETGVIGTSTSPELRTQALFKDRFIGVIRPEHPLATGKVTLAAYMAARHVHIARHWRKQGALDTAIDATGKQRDIAVTVSDFTAALAFARRTDLIATVPERHTGQLRDGMVSFRLPFPVPPMTISLLWHPRLQADPVHMWLRNCIKDICATQTQDA